MSYLDVLDQVITVRQPPVVSAVRTPDTTNGTTLILNPIVLETSRSRPRIRIDEEIRVVRQRTLSKRELAAVARSRDIGVIDRARRRRRACRQDCAATGRADDVTQNRKTTDVLIVEGLHDGQLVGSGERVRGAGGSKSARATTTNHLLVGDASVDGDVGDEEVLDVDDLGSGCGGSAGQKHEGVHGEACAGVKAR